MSETLHSVAFRLVLSDDEQSRGQRVENHIASIARCATRNDRRLTSQLSDAPVCILIRNFANRLLCCGQRFAGSSDATGEIRHIRGVVAAGVFNDNCVAHKLGSLFRQTRLLEDTDQSAWCQIVAWFARDRDPARLLGCLNCGGCHG
jgi:hypothetical protein